MSTTYIEAGKANRLYLRDLWEYRELFWILAQRDILVRYKQTVVGVAWAILRPLATMLVFTVVFGRIAKLPSGTTPYILMVFAGMLPWQFFASTVQTGSLSMISNQALITKIYFPRLIIPTSAMVVSFVDFLISCLVALPLFIYYQYIPGWKIVLVPVFLVLTIFIALGTSYFLASVMVKYRDFKEVVPFMIQFGLYISPVGFSMDTIPAKWQLLYAMNPLVGVICGIRWCLYDTPVMQMSVAISCVFAIALTLLGFYSFRKAETEFADFI